MLAISSIHSSSKQNKEIPAYIQSNNGKHIYKAIMENVHDLVLNNHKTQQHFHLSLIIKRNTFVIPFISTLRFKGQKWVSTNV